MLLIRRITNLFSRSRVDREISDELQSHIDLRAEDNLAAGMSATEARRDALIRFGNPTSTRERVTSADVALSLDGVWADLRYAIRQLRRSPGFTLTAVLTLALAIGANAVVFGVLNGLILRPLNVPQAESLYGSAYGDGAGWQSYPNYIDLRARNHSFEDLAAFNFAFVALQTDKNPSVSSGFATSGNYFDVLKIQPYLGRFFHSSDEHGANSAPYLVLSYSYWHDHFQDDRSVLGRIVQLNQHPFTIIGVAQPGFQGTLLFISPDFYVSIVNQSQLAAGFDLNARENMEGIFEVLGHLKPGITPTQAAADMNAVGSYIEKTYPKGSTHNSSTLSRSGLTSFRHPAEAFMTGLMLLAGLILLGACANLGSLFAAHAADRSREVALRLALGSSRKRILRGLFAEALLISLVGGTVGVFGSALLLHRLSTWQPFAGTPVHLPVTPDVKVYAVALVLAFVSGLLFGIVPMRQVLHANPYEIVKAGSGGRLGKRISIRDVLLVAQIAICAILVTSSLVAIRGLVRTLHSDLGFDRETMLVSANLAMAGYSVDKAPAMQRQMIDAIETIPGVERAGLVNNYAPLIFGAGKRANVFKESVTDLKEANVAAAPFRYDVSPGYFEGAGTSLLAGRSFSWHDDKSGPPVALVNKEFADKMFGSVTNAVGGYYKLQDGMRVQVVGVVEDGKYLSVTEDQQQAMFLPSTQSPISAGAYIVVRSQRDPQELAEAIRSKVRELDAGLLVDTQTWNSMLTVVMFPSRMATMSLGVLGVMGAMLSITGIFGMAAYSVSKRLREFGIRIALGAQRAEVLQAALGRAIKLLVVGSVAGLIIGVLATRVLAYIVYQATPRDPLVLAGVVLTMSLLGLVATWIPARRALSVDPMTLLREE
jgi:predicted permease